MSFNKQHPELLSGEIFIANFMVESFPEIPWESKRMGKFAYDNKGNRLELWCPAFFPVFALQIELEEAGIDILNI